MKVKLFNGPDKGQVEDEINRWLASNQKFKVNRSDQSIGTVSVPHVDAKGKRKSRRVPYIAVTVWYDES